MQFLKSIEGFVLYYQSEGYAASTLIGYECALQKLATYLGDIQVEDITTEHLRGFFRYLETDYVPGRSNKNDKRPLSTASHHRYWKAMRTFFRYADEEFRTGRPDKAIRMPPVTYRAISPFTEDEVRKLINGCDHVDVPAADGRASYKFRRFDVYRNKAIILVLLDTGVRAGEFTRLRVKDVNLETGVVLVHPFHVLKTKPRPTVLGKAGRKALWRYLASREDVRPDDMLFVTRQGRPMTSGGLLAVLARLGKSTGVANVHPHRFRHTFAIQYLRNGGDVFTLQAALGHSRLEMVEHYLKLATSDVEAAHKKASPVDNWKL